MYSHTGVALGLHAVHPFTGASVPIYVADYVLSDYGTKAVMGMQRYPLHDHFLMHPPIISCM